MLLLSCSTAAATQFQGTLYYTRCSGQPNVTSLGFTYDDANAQFGVWHSTRHRQPQRSRTESCSRQRQSARDQQYDGHRLSAGQGLRANAAIGFDWHVRLFRLPHDPGSRRDQFYSSNSYYRTAGPLDTFGINLDGSINNATVTPIAGDNPNVTQLAFAPNGKVLYTDGNPNAFGSIGLFNIRQPRMM